MIPILEANILGHPLLKTTMFHYVPIKHKQMSFVSNGGKFKLHTVLNGLLFPTSTQPRISFERATLFLEKILLLLLYFSPSNPRLHTITGGCDPTFGTTAIDPSVFMFLLRFLSHLRTHISLIGESILVK
jgi:hypothetical protein